MSLAYKEQLKEQAYDDCIKHECPDVTELYDLPRIRCECGYVGPAHKQSPMLKELYCKHCGRWTKAVEEDIPESEWRLPE